MLDINGQELREGAAASLLCEIVAIEPEGIRVRVMNSDMELLIGTHQDEVLGGEIADSELTAFPFADGGEISDKVVYVVGESSAPQIPNVQRLAILAKPTPIMTNAIAGDTPRRGVS